MSSFSLKHITVPAVILYSAVLFLLLPYLFSISPSFSSLLVPSQPRRLLSLPSSPHPPPCSSIIHLPPDERCGFSHSQCSPSGGILNYSSIHFCLLHSSPLLSFPFLCILLILLFYLLARTASNFFSPAVSLISTRLHLSPSMAAVTLLALGNGAPDLFASMAALHTGQARTGFAAVISAGAFVSAFVVGAVATLSPVSPFSLQPSQFIRDVFFYLIAASAVFYIYLSAEIFLWQAVGLISFYIFFVGLVFWMDSSIYEREGMEEEMVKLPEWELKDSAASADACKPNKLCWMFRQFIGKIIPLWEVPTTILLKLTIPSPSADQRSRFHAAANIALCPIMLLYYFSSFIAMDSHFVFIIPHSRFPLWSIVLFVSICLAVAHFILENETLETDRMAAAGAAFVMSVVWISMTAGELLNCLSAIGIIMNLPPGILGLTVLAWGNSVGDLVADVALARTGQPAIAMAGCFAGPMFNLLVGLGSALAMETGRLHPRAYRLQFNASIVVAFVFLLVSLMSSLLVVAWFRFRVPRFWGYSLMGFYVAFTALSLSIAVFSR